MPVQIYSTGNCNFGYADGLRTYNKNPKQALLDLLTQPKGYAYYASPEAKLEAEKKGPIYKPISGGMLLFAQGSEDRVETRPYAHAFKALIEELKLGTVIELPPVPNPLHMNKTGILFVWIVNHKATANWWKKEVLPASTIVTTVADGIKQEIEAPVNPHIKPIKPKRVRAPRKPKLPPPGPPVFYAVEDDECGDNNEEEFPF